MAWPPIDIGTSNTDAGTDNPQLARGDILALMQALNLLRNHFSAFMRGLSEAVDAPAARAALGAAAIEPGTAYPVGCLIFAAQDNNPSAIAAYGATNTGANLYPAGVQFGTAGLFVRVSPIGVGTWRCLGMGGTASGGGNGQTLATLWQRVS